MSQEGCDRGDRDIMSHRAQEPDRHQFADADRMVSTQQKIGQKIKIQQAAVSQIDGGKLIFSFTLTAVELIDASVLS